MISIYPGVGLFAQSLHDAVQPRSHILLEPDEEFYTPFLKPLLKKKNVRLVPKSGIIWQDLQQILSPEYLPHQVEIDRLDLDKDPPRNDTLLIDMNLSMYPKRRYSLFDSMSRMVLYQLVNFTRTSTQFQKYGQVRMLVWIPDDEKTTILPRMIQMRRKGSVEAELVTEYMAEICGKDGAAEDESEPVGQRNVKARPQHIDFESLRQAMVRMRDGGYVTPRGRETRLMKEFKELKIPLDTPLSLTETLSVSKAHEAEVAKMQAQSDRGLLEKGSKAEKRFRMLKYYGVWLDKMATRLLDFARNHETMRELCNHADQAKADGDHEREQKLLEEIKVLNDEYNEAAHKLPDYVKSQLNLLRDQMHVLQQPADLGPVLSWDRRPWEPLKVNPTEFYPNAPCALIDIQPKAPHPLLRHIGPGTSNAGDIFDMMLGKIMQNTLVPLVDTMDNVWPGASEGLEHECETVRSPSTGGSPLTGYAAFASRAANQTQLIELLDKFMRWPFRPSYHELVGRLEDDGMVDDSLHGSDDDGPGSFGMGNTAGDAF